MPQHQRPSSLLSTIYSNSRRTTLRKTPRNTRPIFITHKREREKWELITRGTFPPFRVASETPRIIGPLLPRRWWALMHCQRLFYFFACLTQPRCNNVLDKILRQLALICESKNLPCEQRAIFHAHVRGCESYITHILCGEGNVYVRSCACNIILRHSSILATKSALGRRDSKMAFRWFRCFQ